MVDTQRSQGSAVVFDKGGVGGKRDRASRPNAPVPAKTSNAWTPATVSRPPQGACSSMSNSAWRTRSAVGRVALARRGDQSSGRASATRPTAIGCARRCSTCCCTQLGADAKRWQGSTRSTSSLAPAHSAWKPYRAAPPTPPLSNTTALPWLRSCQHCRLPRRGSLHNSGDRCARHPPGEAASLVFLDLALPPGPDPTRDRSAARRPAAFPAALIIAETARDEPVPAMDPLAVRVHGAAQLTSGVKPRSLSPR